MSEKEPSYTKEFTAEITARYLEGADYEARQEILKEIATESGKKVQSLRAKLVREGVYVAKEYKTLFGNKPETKSDIVTSIAVSLGVETKELAGLEKATKQALTLVRAGVATEDSEPSTEATE